MAINRIRYSILASCCLLLTAGCWEDETTTKSGSENILHVGIHTEPADLDPQVVTTVPDQKVLLSLFEGLVAANPKTLHPEPAVATSWDISENGITYTFHLRKDAKWSNGDPLTANDFVYAYQRLLTPELASNNASLLYIIDGAEAFHQGATTDFSTVGVRAIDPLTLELRLKTPTPYLLSLLSHNAWYPVHASTLHKHDADKRRGTAWTRPGNHVGNGPFRLQAWNNNDFIAVEKNPHYWDAAQVKLAGIRFYPIEDVHAEERAFRAKQLHITDNVPAEKIDIYLKEQSPLLSIHPYLGTYYYILNTQRPPLNDVRVRQALNLAIDRKSLAEQVAKRGQLPAFNFTPPATKGYTSDAKIEESIAQAQALLAEAGYPKGENFPKLQVLFNTSAINKPIAEAIQRMWKDNLNIDVSLFNQEWKTYLMRRSEHDFDIARASWIGDYVDPNTFLELFTGNSSNNFTGWSNPTYDELIAKAARTTDQQQRYRYFQQAEAILIKEAPIIPIYFYNTVSLVQPEVEGFYANLADWHPYKYMQLKNTTKLQLKNTTKL